MSGFSTSGYFQIDPDGVAFGEPPFRVFCDFDSGLTQVEHDSQEAITVPLCSEPDCFQHQITYPTSTQQLINLIDLSSSCTQYIQFDCILAPLSDDGENYGAWLDRVGEKQIYFYGSHYGEQVCSCNEDSSCVDPHDTCNCNAEDNFPYQDAGTITNMTALPITGFTYYGLQYIDEVAMMSFGPLVCSGQANMNKGDSCHDLWLQGVTASGYYQVHSGLETNEGPQFQTVFCNFNPRESQNELSPVVKFEAGVGTLTAKETYQSFDSLTYGSLTYFDLASGTFTVPKTGMYQFWAGSILGDAGVYAYYSLYVNGNNKGVMAYIDLNQLTVGSSTNVPYTHSKTIQLTSGDEVKLYATNAIGTSATNDKFRFRGEFLF